MSACKRCRCWDRTMTDQVSKETIAPGGACIQMSLKRAALAESQAQRLATCIHFEQGPPTLHGTALMFSTGDEHSLVMKLGAPLRQEAVDFNAYKGCLTLAFMFCSLQSSNSANQKLENTLPALKKCTPAVEEGSGIINQVLFCA